MTQHESFRSTRLAGMASLAALSARTAEVALLSNSGDELAPKHEVLPTQNLHKTIEISEQYFIDEMSRINSELDINATELEALESELAELEIEASQATIALEKAEAELAAKKVKPEEIMEQIPLTLRTAVDPESSVKADEIEPLFAGIAATLTDPETIELFKNYRKYAVAAKIRTTEKNRKLAAITETRANLAALEVAKDSLLDEWCDLQEQKSDYSTRIKRAEELLTFNTRTDRFKYRCSTVGKKFLRIINGPDTAPEEPEITIQKLTDSE